MLDPLYFRIDERPDPAVFDAGWVEIPGGRFVLDRGVWRGDAVSRTSERCVVLRVDVEERVWEIKNRAAERSLVLHDESRRRELHPGMAMELSDGVWHAWLPGGFRFTVRTTAPAERFRRHGQDPGQRPEIDDVTRRRLPEVDRARTYLHSPREGARERRLALAHLWREHLLAATAVPQDLSTDVVARAFGVTVKRISAWRGDLSQQTYGRRDWPDRARDLVIRHGVLTRADSDGADTEIVRRGRAA